MKILENLSQGRLLRRTTEAHINNNIMTLKTPFYQIGCVVLGIYRKRRKIHWAKLSFFCGFQEYRKSFSANIYFYEFCIYNGVV